MGMMRTQTQMMQQVIMKIMTLTMIPIVSTPIMIMKVMLRKTPMMTTTKVEKIVLKIVLMTKATMRGNFFTLSSRWKQSRTL